MDNLPKIVIACNGTKAEFHAAKFSKSGRSISKCIKHEGKWLNPIEFEGACGIHARKWRQTIKYDGKPLGQWLIANKLEHTQREMMSEATVSISESKLASPQMDNESADSSLTSAIMDKNAPHSQHLHDTSTNVITQEQEPVPQTMPTCSLDLEAGSPLTQQSTSNMTSLSLNFSQLVKDLEEKLKKTIMQILYEWFENLKATIDSELSQLREKVGSLMTRVSHLESVSKGSPEMSSSCAETVHRGGKQMSSESIVLNSRIDMVCEAVKTQQRMLESRERVERSKNIVVYGLNEVPSDKEAVLRLFGDQLCLTDIHIISVRRLGRQKESKPRPLLVCLASLDDKVNVMKNKRKLAKTSIFINNDLTKEQATQERQLRAIRKKMSQDPSFRNKRISIYKGKIYVDNEEVKGSTLQLFSDTMHLSNTISP